MADFFNENYPQDTDPVRQGAAEIRATRKRLNDWANTQIDVWGSSGPPTYKSGWVTGGMIGSGAIGTTHLAPGVVTTERLADGAVTSSKLAPASVGAAQLVNGGVTAEKLAASLDLSNKTLTLPASSAPVEAVEVYDVMVNCDSFSHVEILVGDAAAGGHGRAPDWVDVWLMATQDISQFAYVPSVSSDKRVKFIPANTRFHWSCVGRTDNIDLNDYWEASRRLYWPAYSVRVDVTGKKIMLSRAPDTGTDGAGLAGTGPFRLALYLLTNGAPASATANLHYVALVDPAYFRPVIVAGWARNAPRVIAPSSSAIVVADHDRVL